ncbi:hypothetical protein [Labilithrix luteola]|nr:hypothetical protein [Labilithrix luteola]
MRTVHSTRALAAIHVLALAVMSLAACSKSGNAPGDAGAGAATGSASAPAPTAAPTVPDGGALNATPLPVEEVAKMVNPSKLPVYTGPTGSIEGTITIEGDPAPETPANFSECPGAAKIWGHAFREGEKGPNGARALQDAVVVVTGYKGFVPEKEEAEPVVIDGCGYEKRTVTLTFGQRLEISNRTKEYWTPMLEPGSNLVMMMAPPKGDPVKIYPKKPGHWLVIDHDRPYAVVDVYAFLHPLHASTDAAGHFRIDGIPVGKLKVGAMHPRVNSNAETEVDIRENVVQKVDLVLHNDMKDGGVRTYDAGSRPILR